MDLTNSSSPRHETRRRKRRSAPAGGDAPRGGFGDHPAPAVVTDDTGVVLDANAAAVRLLSPDGRSALVGRRLDLRFSTDSGREFQAALRRLRRLENPDPLDVDIPSHGRGLTARCEGTPLAAPGSSILWTLRPAGDDGAGSPVGRRGQGDVEREARLLFRATVELLKPRDVETVARRAAGIACRTLADGAAVFLTDDDGELRRIAAAPPAHVVEKPEPVPADHPLLAEMLQSGTGRRVTDPATLSLLFADDGLPPELVPPREAVLFPLPTEAGTGRRGRGILAYLHGTPGGSPGEDVLLLQAYAGVVARAVDRAVELEEAHRARREAEASSRGRYRALASLCHDFRAPLNAILGYADLLLQGIPEEIPPASRRHMESLRTATVHLAEMVSSASGIEGRMRPDLPRREVSLADLLDQVRAIVGESAEVKGVVLRTPRVGDGATLATDPGSLRKILVNLVDNAVKYTDEGEVGLELEDGGGEVVFRIRDTGRGIPPDELPHVFEPFWRGEQHDSPQDGSGLGLAVVRDLVERLDGRIELETSPGEGTVISVVLPR